MNKYYLERKQIQGSFIHSTKDPIDAIFNPKNLDETTANVLSRTRDMREITFFDFKRYLSSHLTQVQIGQVTGANTQPNASVLAFLEEDGESNQLRWPDSPGYETDPLDAVDPNRSLTPSESEDGELGYYDNEVMYETTTNATPSHETTSAQTTSAQTNPSNILHEQSSTTKAKPKVTSQRQSLDRKARLIQSKKQNQSFSDNQKVTIDVKAREKK